MAQKSLERFLNENYEKGHSEFRLVASKRGSYHTIFYIHCIGHDSDTLDFIVDDNLLYPRFNEKGEENIC